MRPASRLSASADEQAEADLGLSLAAFIFPRQLNSCICCDLIGKGSLAFGFSAALVLVVFQGGIEKCQ